MLFAAIENELENYYLLDTNSWSKIDKNSVNLCLKLLVAIENELLDDLPRYAGLIEQWLFALHSASSDFSQLSRIVPGSQGNLGLLKKARSTAYQGYDAVLIRVVRAALPQCGDPDTKEWVPVLVGCWIDAVFEGKYYRCFQIIARVPLVLLSK